MFRLLGFLVGSATSIAIILWVTGIPEFHLENPEVDQKRFDDAVEKLLARKLVAEQPVVESPSVEETRLPDPTAPSPSVDSASVAADDAGNGSDSSEDHSSPGKSAHAESLAAVAEPESAAREAQWYSFWNPFRSEIAANGFVSQLEKVTGLDYRVVRVKTGVYEVAFAYLDDAERRFKLSQISAATGLVLPDS